MAIDDDSGLAGDSCRGVLAAESVTGAPWRVDNMRRFFVDEANVLDSAARVKRGSQGLVVLYCAIALSFAGLSSANDHAQLDPHAPIADLTVVCSPDAPVTKEKAILRAWAVSSTGTIDGIDLTYKWTVGGGRIDETVDLAIWDLSGEKPGHYTATVEARTGQGSSTRCQTWIYLQSEQDSSAHVSRGDLPQILGRRFLLPGVQEKPGYGAYSYLLMGAPPAAGDNGTKERYVRTIAAVLRLIMPLEDLEREVKPSQLNAMYIPVKEILPKKISESSEGGDTRQLAEWVVDHYDYRKAQIFLQRCGETGRDGPYLYSFLSALAKGEPSRPILRQSLVNIPSEQAERWVDAYVNQAAQIRLWETTTFTNLRLQMATIVTNLFKIRSTGGTAAVLGIIVVK